VVWVVALLGIQFGSQYDAGVAEPYFQLASAVLIVGIALWMLWRMWRQRPSERCPAQEHGHYHDNGRRHSHEGSHQRAHADEILRRFASTNVTTGQIILFGLSGGLIPCSAAIALLVLCLQVNQLALGIALVACFSVGLALTLVAAGVVAAVGVRHISRRWSGFGELVQRAPYLTAIVMIGLGLYVGWQSWIGVPATL
jgi:nickel/cobalt transporter (NicO) family protein